MADYSKFAFARINRWIQNDLAEQKLMPKTVKSDGNEYPTIMPAGQQPQVNDSTATAADKVRRQSPFIVYGIEEDNSFTDEWKQVEGITYAIYGPTYGSVMSIIACLSDLCGRSDWSVDDLNAEEPTSDFHFVTLSFEEISGSAPVEQEGGRYAGMVGLRYEFMYNTINGVPGTKGVGRKVN